MNCVKVASPEHEALFLPIIDALIKSYECKKMLRENEIISNDDDEELSTSKQINLKRI